MDIIDFEAIEEAKIKFLTRHALSMELADTLDFKRGKLSLWAGSMKNGPIGRWPTDQEYDDRVKELEDKLAKL